MLKNKKTVLMAVSSSGGHIYPAIALAEKLKASFHEEKLLKIHYIYPATPLAESLLNSYPRHSLALGGVAKGQKLLRKLKTLLQLPFAFFKALFLIQKIKPDLVFGTGGSVTVPVLLAAFVLRKNSALWEGNTQMGLANKFLSVFIKPVFTAFPQVKALDSKKQIWSAYPLRNSLNKNSKESFPKDNYKGILDFGSGNLNKNSKESFPKDKFKLLILGGSQGSVFFNQVVSEAMEEEDWRKDLFIYHQTGERSFAWVNKKYQTLKKVLAFPFTKNISTYYKNCDLIFARAGAGSIWESAHFSKSLVLVPLTYSAGGHQLQNAKNLFEKSCVDLILEKNFNPQSFKEKVLELKNNPSRRSQLGNNLNQRQQKEDKILSWMKNQLKSPK